MEYQDHPASPSGYLPPHVTPVCIGCGRTPEQIEEYVDLARTDHMTPTEWVLAEEGTLNPRNNHFACDECYLQMGMPSEPAPGRWVAP
jgi:hypothetical protein